MRVFVTGATGLLGNTVARQLLAQGHRVAALIRTQPDSRVFEGLDVEFVSGDLAGEESPVDGDEADSSSDSIDDAIGLSDAVIHCAGLIHLGWTEMEKSMQVNREGTRRIVQSCLRHAKKLIYIGTVDSIAVGSRDSPPMS